MTERAKLAPVARDSDCFLYSFTDVRSCKGGSISVCGAAVYFSAPMRLGGSLRDGDQPEVPVKSTFLLFCILLLDFPVLAIYTEIVDTESARMSFWATRRRTISFIARFSPKRALFIIGTCSSLLCRRTIIG
jgi:hypothetical protein